MERCPFAWGKCSGAGRPHLCKLAHDHAAPGGPGTPHACRYCAGALSRRGTTTTTDQRRIGYRFLDGTALPWEV